MPNESGAVEIGATKESLVPDFDNLTEAEKEALGQKADEHGVDAPPEPTKVRCGFTILLGEDGRYGLADGVPEGYEVERQPTPDEITGGLAVIAHRFHAQENAANTVQMLQIQAQMLAAQQKQQQEYAAVQKMLSKGGHNAKR